MCGIFGYVSWDTEVPDVRDLCRATGLLRHRGPDGGGYWHEPGVFFGHRRLSIIDLAGGEQPMVSADGRYVITFNGEIYNYPELRDEFLARGAVFRTKSDTEVILAGYGLLGLDVLPRLQGMFAFALYDRRTRVVLLARDRFGEKPLHIADAGGRLVFGSELAPLTAVLGRGEIDSDALGAFLCLNYVPGDQMMLRGVSRVTPGEYRVYDAAGLRTRGHYWSLADSLQPSEARSDDEHLDELQARIDRATQLTLQSDVPVGLFLSGGVDSSLVAESAARLGRLEAAFCVDFADQGFSEWPTAAKTAHRLGVELVRVPLDVAVLGEFLDVVEHLDDPLADSSALAVWTVARAAAARLKVVLSGDGGDELFGGYLTYPASKWHARLRRFTPRFVADAIASAAEGMPVATTSVKVGASYKLRRFLRALPLETREAHFTWNATWLPSEAARLAAAGPGRLAAADALARIAGRYQLGPEPTIQELQCVDACEYLPHDILAKVDRSTMAHGLESRTPFLNADVAGYALALPERLRVKGTIGKLLLRQLCARHFGAEHAYAPKQGFSLPIHQWLRGDGRALMSSLLARDRVAALGVLDADEVARVVDRHLSGARAYGWELWGLMVLVAWHERRVMSPPDLARLPDPTDMRQVVAMPLAAA